MITTTDALQEGTATILTEMTAPMEDARDMMIAIVTGIATTEVMEEAAAVVTTALVEVPAETEITINSARRALKYHLSHLVF